MNDFYSANGRFTMKVDQDEMNSVSHYTDRAIHSVVGRPKG